MQLPSLIVADLHASSAIVIGGPGDAARSVLAAFGEEARVDTVPDRGSVLAEIDDLFGHGAGVDLVVDGAAGAGAVSARELFVTLLPRIAPDGLYVIDGAVDEDLAMQLSLATVRSPAAIAAVSIAADGVAVRRGPGAVPDDGPGLEQLWSDPFGVLPR